MSKTALITGITGQDGSYLAEFLLNKGYRVYGLIRRLSTPNISRISQIMNRVTLCEGDLSDQVSLDVALNLAQMLPEDVVAVAESGIKTAEDVHRLSDAGYRGFLVGESLMRSPSPGAALTQLLKFR